MKALGRLLPLILIGLLPGMEVNADPSPLRLHLVTLEITDEGMQLNYRAPSGWISYGPEEKIFQEPALFTPLPSIDHNISPARMLLKMLEEPEPDATEETMNHAQRWNSRIRQYLEEARSDGDDIGLYISAAGYDKAVKDKLQNAERRAGSSRTHSAALREDLTSSISSGFVEDITTAGCFSTDNKAEFQGCVLSRILGQKLGQSFSRDNTSVNPPSVHQNELVNRVRMTLKTSSSLYLLAAGSSADVLAKEGDSLLELPAWKKGRITPFGYARIGGNYEVGYRYTDEMIAAPYDQALAAAQAKTPPRELSKEDFLNNATQPLTVMVRTLMSFIANAKGPHTVNDQEQSPAQMMARLYTGRDSTFPRLITGKDFEYFGTAVTHISLIPDDRKKDVQERIGLRMDVVDQAIIEARKIVKRVSHSLPEVLVLFAGLTGPIMKESPELLVIGEQREFYAENLEELLPQLASDQTFINELYDHYQLLTETDFASFDALSPVPRDPAVHLAAGLTKAQFQNWLQRLMPQFGKVHQLTDEKYEDLTLKAMLTSYLLTTDQ